MAASALDTWSMPATESARGTATSAHPSSFEWVVTVVGLIVQQNGAFTSLPLLAAGESFRVPVNRVNTIAVAACSALVALVLLPQFRRVASLARQNLTSVLFLGLVLLSTTWSIHPDITIRRGAGYLLTIALASYLVVRFDNDGRMRALSASFAVSAVCSVLFVVLFPAMGIMQGGELAGAWRGVFPHKNVLGPVMALAIFVELFVIVAYAKRPAWRFALLALYAALLVLSQSATALLLAILYAGGAGLYVVWRRNRVVAAVLACNVFLILLAGAIAVSSDPSLVLSAMGKEATLTGRTTLWEVVLEFIREKPVYGWGYHAMWVLDDPMTVLADRLTGGWGVTSAHNAYLEVTLELGLVGMAVMAAILTSGLWRGFRCCRADIAPLGWFTLVYFVGAILAALTIETLARSQSIDWIVFNVLLFSCGKELMAVRKTRLSTVLRPRAPDIARNASHAQSPASLG